MGLSRDQIAAAVDTATQAVDVPEWGGVVHVKSLTGAERGALDTYSEQASAKKEFRDYRAYVCALALCDEAGRRLFDHNRPDDLKLLGAKSANALERVFRAALAFNRVAASDAENALGN